MEKKKPILVEKNGKKWTYKLPTEEFSSSPEESAAAQEKHEQDKLPVLTALKKSKKGFPNKKNQKSIQLKPLLMAVISAVIIGSVLGFTLIRMFVQVDSPPSANGGVPTVGGINDAETSMTVTTESYQIEPLQSYIIQAGIFSEEANAVEWQEKYTDLDIKTIIWQREDQYFLLAGVAPTKELGQSISESISQQGNVDLYVKEWSTTEGEVELTKEEVQWIDSFHSFWQTELTNQMNATDPITSDKIQPLIESVPKETHSINKLVETLNETSGEPASQQLLRLMHEYEILQK
ncbi:hypothetical protein M3E13_05690 [Oceanobacillus kimchii]|uniref:SPOR domain-containing protein n=1 Tax=Oceanobacillus kimchii TaxID=746691 RepID=A0ABQ5TLW2_9BACI|nr:MULTISPECIES: hypothetical protein [Oceanobacillus]MCT1575768.1 hypothetical protein [Oceanobacillus kimchii]MCT2135405.1 hypothetical protein [Oceanobacillus kimchii]OEH55512.1 hypothetical protein AQ616_04855 [Oceanobacillus sp. E9]GLO66719.1 hypothetical protein MACH08_25030 [Oceanobacillus kimchii]